MIRIEGFGRTADYTPAEAIERIAAAFLHYFPALTETDAVTMARVYVTSCQSNPMPVYRDPAAQNDLLFTLTTV